MPISCEYFFFFAVVACELGLDLCHFNAEQAFVQSELSEDVCMRLPLGCAAMSGRVAKLSRSLNVSKQASQQWHHHLVRGVRGLGSERCKAAAFVMRLVEAGAVSVAVGVHVDGIFGMGLKSICDKTV